MSYRHLTPPAISYYSDTSFNSWDESPGSVHTINTTPPASPSFQHGPLLLPKVRAQDQVMEPSVASQAQYKVKPMTSTRTSPMPPNAYAQYQMRRGSTPPDDLLSPVSIASYDHAFTYASASTSAPAHVRRQSLCQTSTGANRGHSRSTSNSSIDEATISRYGYPTYRRMPGCQSGSSPTPTPAHPLPVTYSHVPRTSVTATSPPAVQAPVAVSRSVQSSVPSTAAAYRYVQPEKTSTLLKYLTAPNPTPSIVHRLVTPPRASLPYFWWDVRNVRRWDSFNMTTILSKPGLQDLLNIPVPEASYLPAPPRVRSSPDSESGIFDICNTHHAAKTNAALAMCLGASNCIAMNGTRQSTKSHQKPDFVASYQSDLERTSQGDSRGRVVGIVRAYEQWNTGMRTGDPIKKIAYLQALAHLQHAMREHGCRYGFIMNEIELVCVRAGDPDRALRTTATPSTTPCHSSPAHLAAAKSTPVFGYLELSEPIRLSTHGLDPTSPTQPQLTVGIALWYLHMLAKDQPMAGTPGWRMEVGAPPARSRSFCYARDSWMSAKIGDREKRDARSVRGWVWPEDPSSRKEFGRKKRRA